MMLHKVEASKFLINCGDTVVKWLASWVFDQTVGRLERQWFEARYSIFMYLN